MVGQSLGRYRIVEKIGAGGMGVVYRARDERLDRDVAVKVLPIGTLSDESARHRFRKEALTLSKLNHPNIETVHDFDTQGGVDFLVMECVPGVTLKEKLAGGALPEKELVSLAYQIAEALEGAHEHGIVHRDLKPGNVMVTPKAQAKVLDFGLAKLLRPVGAAGASDISTETMALAGTLPYMAPEQLRAEKVDARTDLYALGVVLYEMATGQRPFREDTTPRLADAILHQTPVTPRAVNPRVSPELERMILKCLEKEPESRYQSAKELGIDLRRLGMPSTAPVAAAQVPARALWRALIPVAMALAALLGVLLGLNVGHWRDRLTGRITPPRIESLAVLPLENLSGDKEQDYFADGMTAELINDLSKIGALRVISRRSVMRYKATNMPLREIARALNVDAVVEGSVQRFGDRLKITAELIHAATDQNLWGESYERNLRDVLALEDDVARDIASGIKISLSPQQEARLSHPRPVNPQAYEIYLKGTYSRSRAQYEKFAESMEQTIKLDPDYAPAYAQLASYHWIVAFWGTLPPREAVLRVKEFALKALEKDATLAEAHSALAIVHVTYDWDWAEGEREFRRALELNPSDPDAHHFYGHYLMTMNRPEESVAQVKQALELEPLSPILTSCLAWHQVFGRQYDQAREQGLKGVQLTPDWEWAHLVLGWAFEQKSMYQQATAEFEKAVTVAKFGRTMSMAALGHAFAAAGKRREAQQILAELKERSKHTYVPAYDMAILCEGLGDKIQTFEWLQKAYEERSGYLVYVNLDPRLASLRSDPRFQDLVRRIGLPR